MFIIRFFVNLHNLPILLYAHFFHFHIYSVRFCDLVNYDFSQLVQSPIQVNNILDIPYSGFLS